MRTYILEGWEDPFIQSRSVEIAFILIFEDQHPDIQLPQNDLLVINVCISFESTIYLSLSLSLSHIGHHASVQQDYDWSFVYNSCQILEWFNQCSDELPQAFASR